MKLSKTVQFVLGLVGILAVSAVLAPLVSPWLPFTFPRVLSRIVLVLVVGWLIFLVVRSGGFDLRKYGLVWEKGSGLRLLQGLLLGFGTLLVMSVVEMPFGVRVWQFTFGETIWPLKLLKYIFSALFIGLFEEFLFRGLLFRTLSPRTRLIPALFLTNIIYSLSHFLRYSGTDTFPRPDFFSSLEVYRSLLEPFTRPGDIWAGAIGLFLFGMVLSYGYLRTENLILSIGLHAGAVFFLKMDRWFIHVETEQYKIWFGGTDLHASVIGWVFILLMGAGVRLILGIRQKKKGEVLNGFIQS